MRTTRIVGGAAAVLVAAGAVVAFAGNGNSNDSLMSGSTGSLDNSAALSAPATTVFANGASATAQAAPVAPSTGGGRAGVAAAAARVVKTATLTLSVGRDDVARVANAVSHAAEGHGGYVADTERQNGDDAQSATLSVRVPASTYDDTLTAIRKLGPVKNESLGGKDVTGALVDLDARLRSLRAQEQALNALMARANTVGETLQVAQTVGDVRTQIEQLAAQQAQLADQADFATITVNVLGPHAAAPNTPEPEPLLVKSFERAGAGSLAVLGGVIVVLGYALPTTALAALAYALWRRLRLGQPATEA